MRLLIITQKVDTNDPILGFFHRWIIEFAKHCEILTVICLECGHYDLPNNVKVLSLGKETGRSRIKYLYRFYKYIWQERKNYDAVFVHMNQEYVILAGWWWRLIGKKVFMWRNYPTGDIFTRLAVFISSVVFCTSEQSFTARFKKTKIMPVGVDTDFFTFDKSMPRKESSILFLSRMDPIKNPHLLIDSLIKLKNEGFNFSVSLVGDPTPGNELYFLEIKNKCKDFLGDFINILPAVSNTETVNFYRTHDIFVNLTPSGSFDKTIIEAMSSGCLMVATNKMLKNIISREMLVDDLSSLSVYNSLHFLFSFNQNSKDELRHKMRDWVIDKHSLSALTLSLFEQFKHGMDLSK